MLIHGDGGVICWACSVCRRPGCPGKDLVFLWRDGDADAECHVVHEGCIPDLVTSTLLTDEEVTAIRERDLTIQLVVFGNWDCDIAFGPEGKGYAVTIPKTRDDGEPMGSP